MAGIELKKAPNCITVERAPSQGSEGPVKNKPNVDGAVKTKPTQGTGHADGDSLQRRGSGSAPQRLHPNGNSNGAPGKPGIKPPSAGGVPTGKPNITVKPCPPEVIQI